MRRKRETQPRAERDERRKALEAAAEKFTMFRPAYQALTRVRAVPTRFIQLDHATRVGGLPIERFMLAHGPSSEGKTELILGLLESFIRRGHYGVLIDAERTTPITWPEQLMGDAAHSACFLGDRPTTYEDTIGKVREFLNVLIKLREDEEIPADTSALIACDSLRKLVPKDLMKEILESGDDIKAGRDRSAQLRAKMHAAWMDELVPLLERAQAGFIAIEREMKDPDADQWARKFGTDYKVGGGSALFYDASLVIRVERDKWISHGEGKDKKIYGERRRITIRKTKVAGKDDKVTVCHYHASNGQLVPFGFDRARDVIDLGRRFGVVSQSGSWLSFNGERLGSSEHNAVKMLAGNPSYLDEIERQVREQFESHVPTEIDGDGVIIEE